MRQISITKQFIFILTLASILILQGCGGGSSPTPDPAPIIEEPDPVVNEPDPIDNPAPIDNPDPIVEPDPIIKISDLKNIRISIAGSSITNGNSSFIGYESYVGKVQEYLREEKATTLRPDNGLSGDISQTYTNEPMCYKGTLSKYSGKDTVISGTLTGDEISLAYAKERGNEGAAIIEFAVNGVLKDTFSTYDIAAATTDENKNFTGTGDKRLFDLGYAFTFNHVVNGRSDNGHINDEINDFDGVNPKFEGDDWMVIRKFSEADQKVHHYLLFDTPPASGVTVNTSFSYGESIKPGKTTVGNLTQYIGSGVESSFGEKNIPYVAGRDHNVEESIDFRQTDDRAIKTWTFDDNGSKEFTFTIKELDPNATGATPEFFISFVTNRMHYVQNAGIAGFKASDFLATNTLTTTKQIIDFKPNIFILESGTNDAGYNFDAQINTNGTNQWLLQDAIITNSSDTSITLDQTADIQLGDVLVIGNYDIDDVAVRIVKNWNSNTKTAIFDKVLSSSDFSGNTCKVKRIKEWENNARQVITKIQNGIQTPLFLGIGTSGVPDLTYRSLAGYREKGILLADELDAKFVDFYQKTYDWKLANPGSEWSYGGDDTHPNATGRGLFGDGVNEALFGDQ